MKQLRIALGLAAIAALKLVASRTKGATSTADPPSDEHGNGPLNPNPAQEDPPIAPGLDPWDVATTLAQKVDEWQRVARSAFVSISLFSVAALGISSNAELTVLGLTLSGRTLYIIPAAIVAFLAALMIAFSIGRRFRNLARLHLLEHNTELSDGVVMALVEPPSVWTAIDSWMRSDATAYDDPEASWLQRVRRFLAAMPMAGLTLLLFGAAPFAAHRITRALTSSEVSTNSDGLSFAVPVVVVILEALGLWLAMEVAARYMRQTDDVLGHYPLDWGPGRSRRKLRRAQIRDASKSRLRGWVLDRAAQLNRPVVRNHGRPLDGLSEEQMRTWLFATEADEAPGFTSPAAHPGPGR